MIKRISLHGKDIEYDDDSYGIVLGFHERKIRYVPLDIETLEEKAKRNTKQGTLHNLSSQYKTIDYVLLRLHEYPFGKKEATSLAKTSDLLKKFYAVIESV